MKTQSKWILSLALFALVGCKKSDDSSSSNDSSTGNSIESLQVSSFEELEYDNLTTLSAKNKIESDGVLGHDNSTTQTQDEVVFSSRSIQECALHQFMFSTPFQKAENDTYQISVKNVSVAHCYELGGASFSGKANYSFNYSAKFLDIDGNPLNLEGKTWFDAIFSGSLVEEQGKSLLDVDGEVIPRGKEGSRTTNKFFSKWVQSNLDNGPCLLSTQGVYQNDCLSLNYNSDKSVDYQDGRITSQSSEKTLKKFTFNQGVKHSNSGSSSYTNGDISFQINNWLGNMTYGSSSDSTPNYVANNGNETISGTYGTSSSTSSNLK